MKIVKTYSPKTKILSLILSFLIVFYLVPTSAFAEGLDNDATVSDSSVSENEENSTYTPEIYEVTELREENVKHFRLADGSYVAAQYNYPVHYTDGDGQLVDIDNRLIDSKSEFSTNNSRVKFIKKITGNGNIFTLHENNTKITMGLVGAEKKTEGVVTSTHNSDDAIEDTLGKLTNLENISSTILYEDILDGVDIEYIVHSLNIKENIIVKERKENYSYTFIIELNNLTAALGDNGSVYISSLDGEIQYVIPAPVVFDANGTYAPENASSYTLSEMGSGKYELAVTVDSSWMNNENRLFPITIDPPMISSGGSVLDFNIDSSAPDSNNNGEMDFYVSSTERAYLKFNENYFPDVPIGATLTKAELNIIGTKRFSSIAKVGAYAITSDWDSTLTWNKTIGANPQGLFNDIAIDYLLLDSGNNRLNWDITELYKSWLKGDPNYGVGLKLIDETSGESASFVSYEYYPPDDDGNFYEPVIMVTYIYNDGLEDYYPTTTHSAGVGGAGSINLSTGRLTLAIPTLTTTDSLFSFTPTLVYNSSFAGKPDTSAHTPSALSTSYMPHGFKLNVQETIVLKSYCDDNDISHNYYVLYDADGSTHRFYRNGYSGPYYDDDGLRLTLTVETNVITIEDIDHNVKTYAKINDSSWYLSSIKDKFRNKLIFIVNTAYQPVMIYVKPNGQENILMLDIVYDGDKICAIYNDSSKESVIFGYSDNNLSTVKYCYGNANTTKQNVKDTYKNLSTAQNVTVYASATYTYDSNGYITEITDNNTNKSLKYEISDSKVTKLSEYAGATLGQQISYSYGQGYTDIRSTGNNETLDDDDDIITRYVFDGYGRAVNAYSMSYNGEEIYGATLGNYNNSESSKNSLKYSAVLGGVDSESIIENSSGTDGHFATIQGGINTNESNDAYKHTIFLEEDVASLTSSNADMEYIISGFGYSNSIIYNEATDFSIGVDVHYYQGENLEDVVVKYRFKFADVENVRQYVCDKFSCKLQSTEAVNYDYVSKIEVVCSYYGQIDTGFGAPYAYFDDIAITDFSEQGGYNYSYSQSGNLTDKENSLYQEWYTYDEENQITRIENSYGEVYEYQYIEESSKTIHKEKYSKNDHSLSETSYTYDAYGFLTETKYVGFAEDGQNTATYIITTYEYQTGSDSVIFGALLSETDSLGNKIKYFYDDYASGENEYPINRGSLIAQINVGTGTGYFYDYDDSGKLILVLPATGNATSYTKVTNSEEVSYEYESDTQRLSKIFTDTTVYSFEYDDYGNSTYVKAGNKTLATYEYYPNNGKLWKINYGNGFSEEYEYNTLELLSNVWYTYDNGTRVLAYSYTYNADGTLHLIKNHLSGKETQYSYDTRGRLTAIREGDINGSFKELLYRVDYNTAEDKISYQTNYIAYSSTDSSVTRLLTTCYHYDESNGQLSSEEHGYLGNNNSISYGYDNFGRIGTVNVDFESFDCVSTYSYVTDGNNTSNRVSHISRIINNVHHTFQYTYDSNGNITKAVINGDETTYTYDDIGQLKRSVNDNTTWSYTYDNAGNVTSITKKTLNEDAGIVPTPLALAKPISPPLYFTDTDTLSYTNSEWGDLLTSFNGHAITYDGIGNPLSYYNGSAYTFTWTGRQLTGAVKGSKTMSFTYDDNGIRTSKTVNGVTHTYQLNGSQIVSEQWEDKLLVYLYDAEGLPIGMMYRTTSYEIDEWVTFFFEKNLQGDIIAIYKESGTKLVTYEYDAWGNQTVTYHSGSSSGPAQYNPFRYRGYYYDTDLGMYYLQSRYYDAKICRFINADIYVSTGQGLIGNNMFAYCGNNPVMLIDFTGGKAMPFWELLWPGEIHREVQEYLRDNYEYVLEVYVEGKRIDLVKGSNAYEIKPFTVPRELAIMQLFNYIMLSDGKYVMGKYNPELTGSFVSKRGFTVNFYYMGNGIIQYSFYKKVSPIETPVTKQEKNHSGVGNAIIACAAVAGVSAVVCFAGCGGRITPCREMKSPILLGGY